MLATISSPGVVMFAAICCSTAPVNWRMQLHRLAAESPALRATIRQYAAISTFCTSLHEILGLPICSLLIAPLISLARSMRLSLTKSPRR